MPSAAIGKRQRSSLSRSPRQRRNMCRTGRISNSTGLAAASNSIRKCTGPPRSYTVSKRQRGWNHGRHRGHKHSTSRKLIRSKSTMKVIIIPKSGKKSVTK